MASLSKLVIVSLRPELHIHYSRQLPGSSATFPLVAWHLRPPRASSERHPVLAFARDSNVFFIQVAYQDAENCLVQLVQESKLPYKLLSMAWLDSRTMLFIDTTELGHVVNVQTEEELEVVDVADVSVVHSSSFYKSTTRPTSLVTQTSPSPCYHSVVAFSGQLFVLGSSSVSVFSLRTWSDRLSLLASRRQYPAALALARSFLEGPARTVVGLPSGSQRRRALVGESIVEILMDYVEFATTQLGNKQKADADWTSECQAVINQCIEMCILVDKTDLLFDVIFEQFSVDENTKAIFLECLEPSILNDTLKSVSPAVMQEFVAHYERRGALAAVEACVVHMDIATIDIHQVVSLCWARHLYDAILYVYNRGLADYITPLQQLLALLKTSLDNGQPLGDDEIQLGNKVLVYISCCLAGRAYPLGDIPAELADRVRTEVLDFLTTQCVASGDRCDLAYPHMWTLLQFSSREFFNVLALSFEDVAIESGAKQEIVDILLKLMTESSGFSPLQIGMLFTFLARQMARDNNNAISIDSRLFEHVLASLCGVTSGNSSAIVTEEECSRHEERQQALLELLATPALADIDERRLLVLAGAAKFHRVVELIHTRQRDFDKVLSCMCLDPTRNQLAFEFVKQTMSSKSVTDVEKLRLKEAVMENLDKLIQVDAVRTAKLAIVTLRIPVRDALKKVNGGGEKAILEFLQQVFAIYGDVADSFDDVPELDRDMYERHVDLLCKHSTSDSVVSFLRQFGPCCRSDVAAEICRRHGVVDGVIFLLEKSGNVHDAFKLALQGLRSNLSNYVLSCPTIADSQPLENRLSTINEMLSNHSASLDQPSQQELWFSLLDTIIETIRFRNIRGLGAIGNDKNGLVPPGQDFGIEAASDRGGNLEGCSEKCVSTAAAQQLGNCVRSLVRRVLTAMITHVAFGRVVEHVLEVTAGDAEAVELFGNARDLIVSVVDGCRYELETAGACSRIVRQDMHQSISQLVSGACRAVSPLSDTCSACLRPFRVVSGHTDVIEELVCFRCGHLFHPSCLLQSYSASAGSRPVRKRTPTVDVSTANKLRCCICDNAAREGRSRILSGSSRIHFLESASTESPVKTAGSAKSLPPQFAESDLTAVRELRHVQQTSSRLALLKHVERQLLTEDDARSAPNGRVVRRAGGILNLLNSDRFALKLCPPPPPPS